MQEKEITRQLFNNQLAIMDVLAVIGGAAAALPLVQHIHATHDLMKSSALCLHDWEDGFSMNGPTRTCKLCGKWERD